MAIPIQCSNCSDHPCGDTCPVDPKVLYVDEKKFVLKVDKERCLRHKCGKCAEACNNLRFGSIHFYLPEHDYPIGRAHCTAGSLIRDPEPKSY